METAEKQKSRKPPDISRDNFELKPHINNIRYFSTIANQLNTDYYNIDRDKERPMTDPTIHTDTTLNTSGPLRIEWHDDRFYVVGQGNAIPAGSLYSIARDTMLQMIEPPEWDPDLEAFGRGLSEH